MSTVSKSPRKVAAVALEIGNRTLPTYAHRCSRKDFTQPQLFTCLVLRKFHKTDYRGVVAILADNPTLCTDLGLKKVPHFTTPQKTERNLLRDAKIKALLTGSLDLFHGHEQTPPGEPPEATNIELAAADSTGFATDRASRSFIRRRAKGSSNVHQHTTYRRYGKLGIVVDCGNHLILATHRGRGPKPDTDQLRPLLGAFCGGVVPATLLADAGYDSEGNHELLREELEIESIIPPLNGRPTDKLPAGRWRYERAVAFDEETYGQRWQVETVMFMLKRHQGESLTARKYQTRRREMGLMAVTHNVMIAYG